METWQTSKSYKQIEVSTTGTVRNKETKQILKTKKNHRNLNLVLVPQNHNNGALYVLVCNIICEAFMENFVKKRNLTIQHKNGDNSDDRLENLEIINPNKFNFENFLKNDGNWNSIENYPSYLISSNGKVLSIKANILSKLPKNKQGYNCINMSNANGRNKFLVHRLVANAFIPKIEGKNVVNHKNGIKTDNRVENLEWVTHKENTQHAYDIKLNNVSNRKKITCTPVNQYTMNDVFIKKWEGTNTVAKAFNVSRKTISNACNGKIK